jgi:uncharacterized membrane protein YgcG
MRALAFVLTLALGASLARAADPIPAWSPDRVAVSGTPDTYAKLRATLAELKSAVGADYHVCVVGLSAASAGGEYADSAVDYVDQVFETWRSAGAPIDPERGVVIVLAIQNRGIALHPGSRWTRLGFERDVVTRLIDGSSFGQYARSGDYEGALAQLIQAVDWHLALQEREQAKTAEQAQRALGDARERAARLRARADALPYAHAFTGPLLAEVDAAIARAAAAQAKGEARLASAEAGDASAFLARLAQQLDERDRARASAPAELRAARARLERAAASLAGAPLVGEGVREGLAAATTSLEDAERRLVDDDPMGVVAAIAQASQQVSEVEGRQAGALAAHRFRTRTLPAFLGGLGALTLAALVVALRWQRGRRARAAGLEVARWERCLAAAAEKLLALEDEHPVLFGAAAPLDRFSGETATTFKVAAAQADDLFLAFAHAREILDGAKKLVAGAGPLTWGALDRALAALTTDEVEVGTELVEVRRLFLPERRVVRRSAAALLDGLEAAYTQAKERLGALERLVVEVPERLRASSIALGAAEVRIAALEARGPDLPAHAAELTRLELEQSRLAALAAKDPVGIEAATAELAAGAAALGARLQRVDEALGVLEGALARLAEAEARAASLREGEGLLLEEPGFEPEALAQAVREHDGAAREAASAGREEDAVAAARRADEGASELRRLIDETLASRAETPARLAAEAQRQAALTALLPERRGRLDALRALHDDDALRPALDNADEAHAALAFVAQALEQARAGLAPEAQRFLAAAELVRRAAAVLAQVEALYAEVEHKAADLDQARAAAQSFLGLADAHALAVRGLLRGGDRFASQPTCEAIESVFATVEGNRAAQAAPRPHWLRLRDSAGALEGYARAVLARATAEDAACREAQVVLPALQGRVEAHARVLAASTEDRKPANDQLAQARALLADAARAVAAGRVDWLAVLAVLRQAEGGVETSRRLAEQDVSLARSARQAIADSHALLGAADRPFSHGVRVDLVAASVALKRARDALAEHEYERALEEGLRCGREAQEAEQRAEAEARARALREAQERERRERERREREAAARRASSSRSSSSSSFSFSSRSSSRSSSSSSSRSSGGSSFRSSSSGGSSFKRTSSGGSSW